MITGLEHGSGDGLMGCYASNPLANQDFAEYHIAAPALSCWVHVRLER